MKKFNALNTSSKIAICGLPLRLDSYKTCSFNCAYCFANNRKIMEFNKNLAVANVSQFENTLHRVFDKNDIKDNNLIDQLLIKDITLHWGGMSDPFQPCEGTYHITKELLDICNKYKRTVLFSTKSDNLYNCNINNKLHGFQFSFTSCNDNRWLEPNVPEFNKRYELYKDLKKDGFKVGIRLQPFIPGLTTDDIIDVFHDADHFTIEGIKIVPQNKEQKEFIFNNLNLNKDMFTQMGLLNLKPELRLEYYKSFIEKLDKYNLSYSISDNDLRELGNNNCCCGDALIGKSSGFDVTAMIKQYGKDYSLEDVKYCCGCELLNCKAKQLFTSNRTEGCETLEEFYDKRFDRKSSPWSPKFQYDIMGKLNEIGGKSNER